jgi:AmmeMemoRadiSam system protein A
MALIRPSDRDRLLLLARASLEARVHGRVLPAVETDLNLPATGVFVTIRCDQALRGCLGTLDPRERLGDAVRRLAAAVSRDDSRFDPVAVHELAMIVIDLSVLTTPLPVDDISDILVGRDGLIVQRGTRKGLLLPQVALEHGWDRETFVAQTCVKAGLPPDAWMRGVEILRFEAEVFGELLESEGRRLR